ncbi:MAG: hypothetical protein OEX08_01340 [Candidatus Nomurabacteria bacterium]|nr:hypothetical protein [Candidatus Nomurabacteria bacterium]
MEKENKQNDFVDLANCRQDGDMFKKYQKILEENYDPFGSQASIEDLGNEIIDETDHWFIINNQWSYKGEDGKRLVRKHLVVISKGDFVTSPENLSQEALLEAFNVLQYCKGKFGIKGGGMCWRFGDTSLSGASVKRLHFHIIEPVLGEQVSVYLGHKEKGE